MSRSLAAVVEDNWNRGEQRLEVHRLVKLRTYFACYVVIQSNTQSTHQFGFRANSRYATVTLK